MARKETEQAVAALLDGPLSEAGFELVDVEYVRERNWILRLYVDKEGGVDLSDCREASETAGAILDEKDLIPGNYMLEVSSPGMDRVIKKDKDIVKFSGEAVNVKLFAPLVEGVKETKIFTATLGGLSEAGEVVLTPEGRETVSVSKDKIAQMRLHVTF